MGFQICSHTAKKDSYDCDKVLWIEPCVFREYFLLSEAAFTLVEWMFKIITGSLD